jgi:putative ABC transport system permease protein
MLRHYFITAFRQLVRNKFYTAITVPGLAFGIAVVFLIAQYLRQELSYDRFHEGSENIYRIAWIDTNPQTRTPHPLAQAMVLDFPEVESGVSLSPIWGPGLTRQIFTIRNPEKEDRYDESNVLAVDSTFFKVFSFEVLKGDAKTILKNPSGILLSETTALKYFGTTDVVGKQLEVNEANNLVQILAVFKDAPPASHFHFDILVPMLRLKLSNPTDEFYTWKDFGHFNYVRLKPGTDAKILESKLLDWSRKYVNYTDEDIRWYKENHYGFTLQPITSIHLESHLRWELEPNGNSSYVYLMAAAALLILLVGSVNFVNLTLAQSSERMKEIGIRKSLGALRQQVTFQFLGESALVTCLALLLAVIFIEISMPILNTWSGISFSFEWNTLLLTLIPLGIFIALLSGVYPSIALSSAKPALILKDKLVQMKGFNLRKAFIVFQFVASMALISSSAIISQQINFLQHKELGFQPEEVIVLPIKYRPMNKRIEELRTELLKIKGVSGVSATSNIPGKTFNQNPIYDLQNPEAKVNASEELIDADFLKVMNMTIVDGRSFLKSSPADAEGFILNETAVKQLGLQNPVGKEIAWERDGSQIKGPIIGVVKDFHFQSLHEPLRPLLMRLEPRYNFAVIKVNTGNFETTLKDVEKTWRKFDDKFSFESSFLDAQLNQLYQEERSVVRVLSVFSLLGIGIASFGLLGIAALAFRQRTKEVSIRKVLGASFVNLIFMLIKEFTQLVLIAVALAVPLVWWAMNKWLQNFSYQITINPFVFVVTGISLVLVAWATLSFLTMKTATINPAETLKSE